MEQDKLQNTKAANNTPPKQSTWDGDKMMSMAAIFISVLSMFAVIYQSYLAREENELMRIQQSASVLPYLSQWYSSIDSKYKFVIANKGVGPAFIKEVEFIAYDPESKKAVYFPADTNNFIDFINEKSTLLGSRVIKRSPIYTNKLISPNEEVALVTFSVPDYEEMQLIRDEFSNYYVDFNIVYEDVYGTAWKLSSNSNAPIKLKKE